MATRTVRLDDDTERTLHDICTTTGLLISEVLKRGLRSLRDQVKNQAIRAPYDVYRELDLGPGGYAIARSTAVRRGVTRALRKKLKR